MTDARFEELLDAYQMEVVELALDPTRVAVVQRSLARAAIVAYFEERTAERDAAEIVSGYLAAEAARPLGRNAFDVLEEAKKSIKDAGYLTEAPR